MQGGTACPYCDGGEVWGTGALHVEVHGDLYANASIECRIAVGESVKFVEEVDHFNYCPNCGRELKGRK